MINNIMTSHESQNTEFKSSWHDDYLKWICGFANAIGGMIFIGRDDNGKVVGLSDYAKLMEDLPNKIRNAMGIICDVQLHEENDKKYISIQVNPYSVPVSLRGRFYYLSGSTKMELTGVELNEFLIKKAGKTWDDMIEDNATIKDIDEKSIAQFIADSSDKGLLPEPEIVEKNGGVSTTLFVQSSGNHGEKSSEKSSEKDVGEKRGEKRVEKRGEKRGEKLSENRQRILDAMHKDPSISQVKLVEIVGIGSTNIEKNIQYLKDHGYIRRIGPARGGHWEVTID